MDEKDFIKCKEHAKKYLPLLEKIEKNPELKKWCEEYSPYKRVEDTYNLDEEIGEMMHDAYDSGVVICNYCEILDKNRDAQTVDIKDYSDDLLLAKIAYLYRKDHMSEGSLTNRAIAEGHLYRLYEELAKR